MRPLRVLPTLRMETEGFKEEEEDIMIVEDMSTSLRDSCGRPPLPANSYKNENIAEFPDDDFDFDDCDIIETKELRR